MWAWWDVYMDDLSKVFGRCLLRWFLAPYISMLSICVSLPLHVSMCQLVADIRHQLLDQVFLGIGHYLPALLIAICYTATQDQRGQTAHFYVVTIPAQLMPYALLLLNLLNGWMMVYLGLCGLLAAHFHDFCTRLYPEFGGGPNLLPTPWFISWLISTPRVSNTSYGSSYVPPRDDKPRSGPLPDSWRSAGPGRRLG
jgi:Derlin-2/3